MPGSSNDAKKAELDRRYLAQNYGDEASNIENDKVMTEEEWLEKEKKEI